MIRIVVCMKEVPDPDAVNSYAVAGRLVISEDGKTLAQSAITPLTNAYDEQALEAALRLRDAGVECAITAVSVGADPSGLLKRAAVLGADEIVAVQTSVRDLDWHATAALLAAYIGRRGDVDLVLCGRQASDDDQGVVPAIVGELLGMPVITIASAVEVIATEAGHAARVRRVTPEGNETVEAALPAVVTISNELGQPRYPTAARSMAARRMQPEVIPAAALGVRDGDMRPRVELQRIFVPESPGMCEFIKGDGAAAKAEALLARLHSEHVL
jgi:electron transfer flavoprotein beta subunit